MKLLSGIFDGQSQHIGRTLVLDGALIVENTESKTFAAISSLRETFEACILLTGIPLHNDIWIDAFALLGMRRHHHPVKSSSSDASGLHR